MLGRIGQHLRAAPPRSGSARTLGAAGAAASTAGGGGAVLEVQDCTANRWRLDTESGELLVTPSSHGRAALLPPVAFPLPRGCDAPIGIVDDNAGAIWLTDGGKLWYVKPTRSRPVAEHRWHAFDIAEAVPTQALALQIEEEGALITNLRQLPSGHACCGIQPSTRIPVGTTDAEAYAFYALSVVGRERQPVAQSIDGVEFPDDWSQAPRLPFGEPNNPRTPLPRVSS